ncbi:hypothetical protein NDU88_004846 [Pleurodeles waltl]|uniref:Uncharacterized protein n=1 Tax=Pleurodeles waltl TaxID=8319 RepID=A0AAV7RM53_PLEWA|nr:hypothetical protein NDU88_004846 [Pleurodeles waltl]
MPGGVGHDIVCNCLSREPHLLCIMGNDRVNKGTQQTRMDQYTAQNAGASLQKDPPATLEKGTEPTGAQILAAIESSSRATQIHIEAIAVDAKLLRADLRTVAEHSVATEQKVTCMQSEVDINRFSSDHAPLLLECETHILKPAIPLWRLRPDLLGDPKYKQDLQGVLNGYFSTNWDTGNALGIEWEALKVVIRGESLSKTCGIRKRLEQELTRQVNVLTALQRQIDNGDAPESACLEMRGRIVELWDRLDSYVRQS